MRWGIHDNESNLLMAESIPAGGGGRTITSDEVRKVLRQVKDPEVNLNIIDLGLVYDVLVDEGDVSIKMTLTSPGCPAGPEIVSDADRAVRGLDGVTNVDIEIVWEPYWTPERIEPKVRAFLGM